MSEHSGQTDTFVEEEIKAVLNIAAQALPGHACLEVMCREHNTILIG